MSDPSRGPKRPAARAGRTPGQAAPRRASRATSARSLNEQLVNEQLLNEQLTVQLEDLASSQTLLEESRDRYAALFDNAPIACVTTDRHGVIEDLNPEAAALLRVDPPRGRGATFRALLAPSDRRPFRAHLRECETRSRAIGEVLLQPLAGAPPVPVELRSRLIATEPPRILTAILDLSVTKRLEADLRRLGGAERSAREANQAKDDFIAMLSHELRSPLTPVLIGVTALQRGGLTPARVEAMYETIRRNVHAEVHLVDDLLDVTRIVRGKIQLERGPTDLHELIRETLDGHSERMRAKGLAVELELDADRHHTSGDRDRLRQVLENLLDNAVKFTPAAGRITVSSWNADGSIAVEVRDSGIGMEAEALARVFNPFEQAREGMHKGGLGLGLAISRGIIEMHGGTIEGHSHGPGTGTRFVIHLDAITPPTHDAPERDTPGPEADIHEADIHEADIHEAAVHEASERPPIDVAEGARTPDAAASRSPSAKEHVRVLLVDDNEDIVEMLRELLELEGCQVIVAGTAEEALRVDPGEVEVIISDLGLPGMSGYDLVRRLRERSDVPAIALSGYGSEKDRRASSEAGFSVHLTKPVDGQSVMNAIERALHDVRR